MRIVYGTDFHGHRRAIRAFLRFAESEHADLVLFGGDLTPKRIALRLPDEGGDDEGGDDEMTATRPRVSGAIIPLPLPGSSELQQYLTKALAQSDCDGATPLAQVLQEEGYAIWDVANRFFDRDLLLDELRAMELLHTLVTLPHDRAAIPVQLMPIFDCLEHVLIRYEETFDDNMRSRFLERARCTTHSVRGAFDQLRPSRLGWLAILGTLASERIVSSSLARMFNEIQRIGAVTLGEDPGEDLRAVVESWMNDLLNARNVLELTESVWYPHALTCASAYELEREAMTPESLRRLQWDFLTEWFLPEIQAFRAAHPDIAIAVMLGNDDVIENIEVLQDAERVGALTHLEGERVIRGLRFVGYSHVSALPPSVTYRAWERQEADMANDLRALRRIDQPTIWLIHEPPAETPLADTEYGSAGSSAVRSFMAECPGSCFLFGHIHEAPERTGQYLAEVDGTIGVNPGALHQAGLDAVVFDTADVRATIRHTKWGRRGLDR